MQKNTTDRQLRTDNAALNLVELLDAHADDLGLTDAQLYFEFPILKDLDGVVVISKVLIVSREHGVLAISTENTATPDSLYSELGGLDEELDHLFSLLFSRLVRNKALRKSKTELAFPTNTAIYAPFVSGGVHNTHTESPVIFTARQVLDFVNRIRIAPLDEPLYEELVATVEGAKGLIRPKARDVDTTDVNSKGRLANMVEAEIASFDQRQKLGYMAVLDGLQRIRGLAGSGKTVVLAMKAALTHIRNPESHILYTFYTKSLYQHIRRLITRFYRQFEDKDPDWNYLKVMHAWGGYNNEGVLFNACKSHDIEPLAYSDAYKGSSVDPFGYACRRFLNTVKSTSFIFPTYDYVFIDEGQDFPAAFIELCIDLTLNNRVVFAYDDLQTIFQARTPSIGEIVGTDVEGNPLVELTEDIVLYKCYRNPREIIVCAHALGFGLYASRIVQMLENKEQWEDVGYRVVEGDFVEGSRTVIERPAEHSLPTISKHQEANQIIQAVVCNSFQEEIDEVVRGIRSDIEDGLKPEDILVVVVDDRNVQVYIDTLVEALAAENIFCNNIHSDRYGIRDFHKDGFITLSTVHKAKGNEAYMVYVMGVDAIFTLNANVRDRNKLFTAMTRAKGWVKVTGVGENALRCKAEIDKALENFPRLVFDYPSQEQLKVLKRDLAEKAIRKQKAERQLDLVLGELTPEEIQRYVTHKEIKKGK